MTRKQQIHLMTLWRDACEEQVWNPADAAKRHDVYCDVLGTEKRFHDFDQRDFSRVKARFLMLAGNLQGAIEDGDPDANQRRQLLWRINQSPEAYVRVILQRRFHAEHATDLDTPKLVQLRNTLAARSNQLRKRDSQKGVECPF